MNRTHVLGRNPKRRAQTAEQPAALARGGCAPPLRALSALRWRDLRRRLGRRLVGDSVLVCSCRCWFVTRVSAVQSLVDWRLRLGLLGLQGLG